MILDTNALSAFADGDQALFLILAPAAEVAVPIVALGEFLFGIGQSRLRVQYERWLQTNLPLLNVLPAGQQTARCYADIRRELKLAGQPIPSNDIWIAALAREHGLPLVTRDSHFERVRGLRVFAW